MFNARIDNDGGTVITWPSGGNGAAYGTLDVWWAKVSGLLRENAAMTPREALIAIGYHEDGIYEHTEAYMAAMLADIRRCAPSTSVGYGK